MSPRPRNASDATTGADADAMTAYLALGSNLGDRRRSIEDAIARLDDIAVTGVQVVASSPLYETDAVSPDPQPPYLNAVLRVDTTRTPADLLSLCLEIERALGRVRPAGRDKASRTLDIDVLLYGDQQIDTPTLTVPHPALLDRPFVRIPLANVARPDLRHPHTGDDLTQAPASPGVRRLP
jgi:2-amino-4-hydroxy-6-hydroxymethyldihydropteridine diphosphokinase